MSALLQAEINSVRHSGLFLSQWYLRLHTDASGDGAEHFCVTGWRKGAWPNPYFDPAWYRAENPGIDAAGINPLLHYLAYGEAQDRDPCPHFFTGWYRRTYGLEAKAPCLSHFLAHRLGGQVSPVPLFDPAWYLEQNPDVAGSGADPFEHFLRYGAAELRAPAPGFDIAFYTNRYRRALGGQNPLLHYLAHQDLFLTQRPDQERGVAEAVKFATRPGPEFEELAPLRPGATPSAKLLAYYLPQYHRVAENDAWWGKGFTDWTNLGRAMPRFAGHLQPRIPRDLGYYSLDDPATLPRQIALAKGAGLSGFVFYTYWFNGRTLLDKPMRQLLADPALDFPFCTMWANENWTRSWDGRERDVLVAQDYRESDDAALVAHFAGLFADARYIRLEGRPLWMIYRVGQIPDASRRIARWRSMFQTRHGENPLIVMAQSAGDDDPAAYGLEGAVEFPPHKLSQETPRLNATLDLFDETFAATVHDYEALAETSLRLPVPDHPLIKTIVPGWDNEPRREGKSLALHGASPARYQAWLENLLRYSAKNPFYGERILCVNAWNEWAEGAFLEPDLHFGAAFLNATARALCPQEQPAPAQILLIGHDAHPHGAQMLLLHLARRLRRQWGFKVFLLLLGPGTLQRQYDEVAEVSIADDATIIGRMLDRYHAQGLRAAIVNSAAAARVIPWAEARGIATTLLVHEMPQMLREQRLEAPARLGAARARKLVFASISGAAAFFRATDLYGVAHHILPQGLYQPVAFSAETRRTTRQALGVVEEEFLVLGAGFAHLRKGFDLFLQLARSCVALRRDVHFCWVGDIEKLLHTYLAPEMARTAGRFHHVPFTDRIADYYAAADVFALTSREDPYPSVVLEALSCGLLCIAFEGSGGMPELLRRLNAGAVAQQDDPNDFQSHLLGLLDHTVLAPSRPRLAALAAAFDFAAYTENLLRLSHPSLRSVSACVLNHNYARYLTARLTSIFAQTYPLREILLLDDSSTDDSLAVAAAAAQAAERELRVIPNARNEGVFAQWRRAAEAAQGDYVWLCEADDEAAPDFLARLLQAIGDGPAPLIAFTDSRAIDADGQQIMPSYQSYYLESGAPALTTSGRWEAQKFAALALGVRNLIPNVSAVLWRRDVLRRALNAIPDLETWRLAGDWRLYLAALTGETGEIVYVAAPLNTHRRHPDGVTQRLTPEVHLAEVARMHDIAAQELDLDAAARTEQAAYRGRLREQFLGKKVAAF
jgi:glycosyltransferase involved in cell wall biosynthesis